MQYEWSNINDIAIELSEKFPDIDPQWISFPDLHKKITELAAKSSKDSAAFTNPKKASLQDLEKIIKKTIKKAR